MASAASAGGGGGGDNSNNSDNDDDNARAGKRRVTRGQRSRELAAVNQKRIDLTIPILTIVLERQRQCVRRKRVWQHGRLLRLNEMSGAETGGGHELGQEDDGEGGAVAGDGEAIERDFQATCCAAAGVCRSWRALALGAIDCMVLRLSSADAPSEPPEDRAARGRAPGDLLAALRLCEPGLLRFVHVRGVVESGGGGGGGGGGATLRPMASALAELLAGSGRCKRRKIDEEAAAVAAILRELRVLPVEWGTQLLRALFPRGLPAAAAASPPPPQAAPRPLLASLVTLSVAEIAWRWADRDRYPQLFSRRYLPSLRALLVGIAGLESDAPFEIVAAPQEDVLRLTRLEVLALSAPVPQPQRPSWPVDAPLVVSARALAALRPTLRALRTMSPWAAGFVHQDSRRSDGSPLFSGATAALPDMSEPRGAIELAWMMFQFGVPRLPPRLQQWQRLVPGLAPLADGLTELSINGGYDLWRTADGQVPTAVAARRQWRAGARALFAPMAPRLRRLSLHEAIGPVLGATLPPALSRLSALTYLRLMLDNSLESLGPLRKMTGLRALIIEPPEPEQPPSGGGGAGGGGPGAAAQGAQAQAPEPHAPIYPHDIAPLVQLVRLRLASPPPCLAPVIAHGLPQLQMLELKHPFTAPIAVAARTFAARPDTMVLVQVEVVDEEEGRMTRTTRGMQLADLDEEVQRLSTGAAAAGGTAPPRERWLVADEWEERHRGAHSAALAEKVEEERLDEQEAAEEAAAAARA